MQCAPAIIAITLASLPLPALAAVEPAVPAGTVGGAPADAGTKEIEGQGTFGTASEVDPEAGDALEWDLSFGALAATGNAPTLALNGGTNFLLRRGQHQLTAVGLGNYGRTAPQGDDGKPDLDAKKVTTLSNVQGRVRYDYFLGKHWSLFAMATARHDPFQDLDLRLNVDPGVAWYVINTESQRLSAEAGYDFQFDVRADEAIATSLEPVDKTEITHAVRLAGGYINNLNESVSFRTGLEYLQSVQRTLRWRINWDVGLSTSLFGNLALAATFNLRIDNDPLPGVRGVDTITALSLVYRFF
jgi:putative salt-induced outer membrane protein YdiY